MLISAFASVTRVFCPADNSPAGRCRNTPKSSVSVNSAIRRSSLRTPYRCPYTRRFSATLNRDGNAIYGDEKFIRANAANRSVAMSCPRIRIDPALGISSPSSIAIVVVFPAPLPPSNPSVCPAPTENPIPSTARTSP